MNIFVTSTNPAECAHYLDDKRVVKMVLESTQLLCTAINEHGGTSPYRSTHKNHPCSVWVRENYSNWKWLWEHAMALAWEYSTRYNKIHKCQAILEALLPFGLHWIPSGELTSFPNCARNKSLNLDYTHVENTQIAYQLYLNDRWDLDKRKPTWRGVG